jgi:hypothetical protein
MCYPWIKVQDMMQYEFLSISRDRNFMISSVSFGIASVK